MPKINIGTKLVNGQPILSPFMAEDGGVQLHYNFDKNMVPLSGGYSVIGPGEGKSVLVMVEASDAAILAIRSDLKYLPMDTTDKVRAANWLAANTDVKNPDVSKEVLAPVLEVHKLDKVEYEKLIDTPWAKVATALKKSIR